MRRLLPFLQLLLLWGTLPGVAPARAQIDAQIHHAVADTALARAFFDYGRREGFTTEAGFEVLADAPIFNGLSFGALSAHYAADDLSRGRFHRRGQPPYAQLKPVSAADLDALWTAHNTLAEPRPDEATQLSVVANYLRHHYLALRFADAAGKAGSEGQALLRTALAYEALAVGYLTDAFSAGHLLAPNRDGLARLQPTNHRAAHRYFNVHGAFVANLDGDVWQTSGDPLMLWYPPTRHALLHAVHLAVRELFWAYTTAAGAQPPEALAAWHRQEVGDAALRRWTQANDGPDWLAFLPSLRRIPFPVTATWSIRAAQPDSFGVHPRRHYAQLRTLHDPDTGFLEPTLLYPPAAFSADYLPDVLTTAAPDALIWFHPDVASVRYHQRWSYPASYKGLLVFPTSGYQVHRRAWTYGVGVGYGLWDTAMILFKHGSVAAQWLHETGPDAQDRLHFTLGGGLAMPVKAIDALRVSGGLAVGLGGEARDPAPLFSLELDFATLPLGLGYTGVTLRAAYQWQWSDTPRHGPGLFLIIL